MSTLTKSACYALLATVILSACSRPYATFQKTTPEHFYAKKTSVTTPTGEKPVVDEPVAAPAAAPAVVAEVQTQLNELVAANKTELATHKKLATRINRVQQLLATSADKQALSPAKTKAKMSLMAKMVSKKINKQIEKKLAPKQPQTQSAIRLGIIVGIVGLLLIIIGNSLFSALGVIALVVGLIGILLGYLDVL